MELITEPVEASPFVAEYGAQADGDRWRTASCRTRPGPHPSERSTRHLELAVPEGVTYQRGRPPRDTPAQQRRAGAPRHGALRASRRRSSYASGTTPRARRFLPVDQPVRRRALLSAYVDLQDVATRSEIQVLAEYTECPPEKEKLLALGGDDPDSVARYREEVLAKNVSLIDLLEEFRACELPFNVYLELLPPLKPRYYSISSSPLVDAARLQHHRGGGGGARALGAGRVPRGLLLLPRRATRRQRGRGLRASSQHALRAAGGPATPMIMVAAGTGLAPFRGSSRSAPRSRQQGEEVGPSSLFFGCRNPEQDYIYEDELEAFAREGVADLECAFSRLEGQPKTYVQDRIRRSRTMSGAAIQDGATIYVCGDAGRMAPDVEKGFVALYREENGASEQDAESWMAELKESNRYLVDVWPRN